MKIKDLVPANKPRNFVAKNAMKTTSGSGAHRDKKHEQKKGYEKHKNKNLDEIRHNNKNDMFSYGGRMPATDRIPQDSTRGQNREQAIVAQMKQGTINGILTLKPEWGHSDLELMTATELNQILRDLQAEKAKKGVAEAGPFRSTEPKKPRKGSVADFADKKRREQERGKPPIEPRDQMVGVAKVTKDVSEGEFGIPDIPDFAQFYNKKGILVGTSDHNGFHFTPEYYKILAQDFDRAQIDQMATKFQVAQKLKSGVWTVKQGMSETVKKPNATTRHLRDYPVSDKDVAKPVKKPEKQKPEKGVAEGYTGRETKDGIWRVFKDGKAVAVAGPFKSREEAADWIKKQKQGVAEGSGGAKYKIKSIGKDSKGDYYISPSTGKKVYKQAKVGDHENPKTGEHKSQ